MSDEEKVLVYWLREQRWSVVSKTAVESDGDTTVAKWGGKWYPVLIIAKDHPKALERAEEAFKKFLNSCLAEEAAENVEKSVREYVKSNENETVQVRESSLTNKTLKRPLQDEAKQVRAEEAKIKRLQLKEREEVNESVGNELMMLHGVKKDRDSQQNHITDQLSRIENKVDSLYSAVDTLLGCRSCIRKVYKKMDTSMLEKPTEPMSSMPVVTDSSSEKPIEQQMVSEMKDCKSGRCPNEEDELTFVGDTKYNIRIPKQALLRSEKTSKTPEKLALNLIEFILTPEEFQSVTVYGNPQHKKRPMDADKRRALRSHIFSIYKNDEGKWDKITKALNDKIRKHRAKLSEERN